MPFVITEVDNRMLDLPARAHRPKLESRSVVRMIAGGLSTPILTPVLDHMMMIRFLVIAAFFQIILTYFGFPAWRCPINSLLGLSCPGCGLSSATALLIRGDWNDAIQTHAFSPVILLAFLCMTVFSVMPETFRLKIIKWISLLEKKTGVVIFTLLFMLIYWGIRIADII